jgi:hypothetical protein
LRARLPQVRRRTEQAYLDKLDGKITEVFWATKSSEWNQEEQQILMALDELKQQSPEKLLDGAGILELANKVYFLYLRQPLPKKRNCSELYFRTAKSTLQVLSPHIESPST